MKLLGHTSSGKPVYAAYQFHRNFDDWTANDHADAADLHQAAAGSDIKTNVSMHENSAALHNEEAQRIYRAVEKLGLSPKVPKAGKPKTKRPARSHSTRGKTIILGKTPYRVMKRRKVSISLQPVGTEYPHSLLLSRTVADPSLAKWRGQWGHVVGGNTVAWYRQLSDDVFEKIA